ncbi:transmembrane protein, putative (macronuclear) [Tetrahymena thermophila SB210]|uniref:Transmembrane protein, putative n=1 Tax=Tetrahymena thermophila (strain SB210) TaxID=312017 RepID=Q23I83_TETTS|nr:transmembrane protein, putative [Tetrahymena thermophila SB210]EAR96234.2 transmembrane protein, putative [Tetrahymena thermophila SB210]|eukprot:XP_001016479.2 transmembrane protein, putative [Tetrahymena thermophila SB210]
MVQYYYWDFIRIYLRIIVTLVYTLIGQIQRDLSINIILLTFALYIMLIIKYNPYITKRLSFNEITSCALIMVKLVINNINLDNFIFNTIFQIADILINIVFVLYFICIIFIEKSKNQNSILGKIFKKIIIIVIPKKYHKVILNDKRVSIKTYFRWILIKKNINKIVQMKAATNFKIALYKQESMKKQMLKKSLSQYSRNSQLQKQDSFIIQKKNIFQNPTLSNFSPKIKFQDSNKSNLKKNNSLKDNKSQLLLLSQRTRECSPILNLEQLNEQNLQLRDRISLSSDQKKCKKILKKVKRQNYQSEEDSYQLDSPNKPIISSYSNIILKYITNKNQDIYLNDQSPNQAQFLETTENQIKNQYQISKKSSQVQFI